MPNKSAYSNYLKQSKIFTMSEINVVGFINKNGSVNTPVSDKEWEQLLEDMPWIKEEDIEEIPTSQWVIDIKAERLE